MPSVLTQTKENFESGRRSPVREERLEALTQRIGRALFRRLRSTAPSFWRLEKVEDSFMKLMMRDEDLRFRMLQFVDVFPALGGTRSVSRHLEEYLSSEEMGSGAGHGPLGRIARHFGRDLPGVRNITAATAQLAITRMGNHFIAGHTPEEVAVRIRSMEARGFHFTLDLLGEFVASEAQADEFARRYREMIEKFEDLLGPLPDALADQPHLQAPPRVNLSIKLSSLTSKFDPMDPEGTSAAVRERLRPLVRAAREHGAFINVDMEKYEFRETTFRIMLDLLDEEEFRGFPHFGTVAQAYLWDAEESLRWLLGELAARKQPMTIRLVKGAYWDSEQIWARQKDWPVPVITDKRLTDAMFERCTRILMEAAPLVRTAIASHNVRSVARALALRKMLSHPPEAFEVQMLYGMAGPIKDAVLRSGVPVRIYTPCGELLPGMSYLVRRILENTSNESFLRQRFSEGAAEEKLLASPHEPGPEDFEI